LCLASAHASLVSFEPLGIVPSNTTPAEFLESIPDGKRLATYDEVRSFLGIASNCSVSEPSQPSGGSSACWMAVSTGLPAMATFRETSGPYSFASFLFDVGLSDQGLFGDGFIMQGASGLSAISQVSLDTSGTTLQDISIPFYGVAYFDCSFPGGGSTSGCFPGPGPLPAPEPSTEALMLVAFFALGLATRRRAAGNR
jgi:hypothetical protein